MKNLLIIISIVFFTRCSFFEKTKIEGDLVFENQITLHEDPATQAEIIKDHKSVLLDKNLSSGLDSIHYQVNHFYNGEIKNLSEDLKKINYKLIIHPKNNFYNQNFPIFLDDNVFFLTKNGELCKYFKNEKKWSIKLSHQMSKDSLYLFGYIKFIENSDSLFVILNDGTTFLLKSKDGSIIWKKKIHQSFLTNQTCDQKACYLVSSNANLYKVSLEDGSIIWNNENKKENDSFHISNFSSGPIIIENHIFYFNKKSNLIKVNKENGKEVWSKRIDFFSNNLKNTGVKDLEFEILPHENNLILGSNSMKLMLSINQKTGDILWVNDFSLNSRILKIDNFGFFFSDENKFCCINLNTGKIKWINDSFEISKKYKIPKYLNRGKNLDLPLFYSSPIMVNNSIYVNSYFGEFFEIDKDSGNIINKNKDFSIFITGSCIFIKGEAFCKNEFGEYFTTKNNKSVDN